MKIFDVILDKINKTTLFEMARSRSEAKSIVTNYSSEIVEHLIKLFVFDDPMDYRKWIIDIDSLLDRIDRIYLKPNTKKLDSDTVYNWLVFDSSPHYSGDYVNSRVKKMLARNYKNISVRQYDTTQVMTEILKILKSVSKDIGDDTFISIEDYLPQTLH